MEYKLAPADSHPLPFGTQARACSEKHGWIFGPVVWSHKIADNGIYVYTVQDAKYKDRTVDVAAFQIETLQQAAPGGANQIVEVKLSLMENGHWEVAVRKTFAPENGGGEQWFREDGGVQIHRALDTAREMVTLSPAQRSAR